MANLQPTDHANCSDLIIAICKQHEAVRRDLNRLSVTLQDFDVSIELKASEGSLQDDQVGLSNINSGSKYQFNMILQSLD